MYSMKKTELIDKKSLDANYKELCKILYNMKDEKSLQEFLDCLFTPSERKDFALRWILVKELHSGTTQRDIVKKLNMSLCKITRGARELNKADSAFKKILESKK